MAHALALEPELAAVALDHVAHRQRQARRRRLRIGSVSQPITVSVLIAGPVHTRSSCARPSGRRQAQLHQLDVVLVGQPAGQVGQRLQQREAVDLQPQRRIDIVGRGAAAVLGLDAARGRGHQVGAEHVFQRPARLQGLRACGWPASCMRWLIAPHLVADHAEEALARRARRGRGSRASPPPPAGCPATRGCLRSGRAAAGRASDSSAKSRVMLSSISTKPLSAAASPSRRRIARTGAICTRSSCPARRAGDELRRRVRRAALQPLLHALQRVGHQRAVEHGVDRAAQADQLGAAGQRGRARQRAELRARAAVVEQDAAVEVADHDALRQLGHQRGQAVALLLDAAAGGLHLRRDVGAQRAALARQLVDRPRPARASRRCPAAASSRCASVASSTRVSRPGAPAPRPSADRRCAAQRRRADSHQPAPAAPARRVAPAAPPARRARPARACAETASARQRQPGGQQPAPGASAASSELALVELQASAPSISRTLCGQLAGRERFGHVGVGAERACPWPGRCRGPWR